MEGIKYERLKNRIQKERRYTEAMRMKENNEKEEMIIKETKIELKT